MTPVTTVFGLDAAQLRPLVEAITPAAALAGASDEGWTDRFARIAWTTLSEPGDGVAGAVVESIGPSAALDLVLKHAGGSSLRRDVDGIDASTLTAGLARWTPRLSAVAVIRSLEQASRFGIECSAPTDPWWPTGLADLGPCSPVALWTRGSLAIMEGAGCSAAVVGARAATGYGEAVAMELAAGLGDRGVTVVSGGAYGIDGQVHRTALAGGAPTIAVLAGGLDRLYPAGHEELLTRIAGTGVLVAEVPCGVPPTRWRFLQRNRIIAAMTGATIVVEAGHRSGSLNTAGHAAAIGRPLGAVPGAVTSAASAGCHRLLREYGATCITGPADALELLGIGPRGGGPGADGDAADDARRSAAETRVLDAVHPRSPRSTGEIAGLTGMGVADVLAALGLLENDRVIRRTDAGDWVRARTVRG